MLFSEMNLKQGLLKGLAEMKYTNATDIQTKVIQLTLANKNIVGQSQTGTGKTAAFLVPLLQKIDTNKVGLQALILAPTRELVNQIGEEIFALTKYYRVNAACVYGGASPLVQKKNLNKRPSIIVATPGRLMDFINQKVIDISKVSYLILDEVDRMLDMGFVRDIQKIRGMMHHIQQTSTFSATISPEIKEIIKGHIPNYEFIKIGETVTVDKINHSFISVPHEHKIFNLLHIINKHSQEKILIFTQTKRNTKTLLYVIEKAGYKVGMLNGNMSQGKRNATLQEFKDAKIKILVTTDVAARGLNMDNVGLVVNFDVPKESESYIHRIGRTGRAGAFGKAIMLVSPEEEKLFADIEKTHRTRIKKSDHLPVVDTSKKFSGHKLDKSTDKFGKGRPNPLRQGEKTRDSGPRGRCDPRSKEDDGTKGRSSAGRGRKPFRKSFSKTYKGTRDDDKKTSYTGKGYRSSRDNSRPGSKPTYQGSRDGEPRSAAHKRPFRGAGKGYNTTRKTFAR